MASVAASAIVAAGLGFVAAPPAAAGNGDQWSAVTGTPTGAWLSVAAGNGVLVAVGRGANVAMRSTDGGTTWTSTSTAVMRWNSVTYAGGTTFVAVGWDLNAAAGAAMVSTDSGATWTAASVPASDSPWSSVASGGSTLVAIRGFSPNSQPLVMRSADGGATWAFDSASVAVTSTGATEWQSVTTNGTGTWMAVGRSPSMPTTGIAMVSTDDGVTWTALTTPSGVTANFVEVEYGGGTWLAMGDTDFGNVGAAKAMTSSDAGQTWTPVNDANVLARPRATAYGSGVWVVVGQDATYDAAAIRSTDNGATWAPLTLPDDAEWSSIVFGGATWAAVAEYAGNGGASVMTAPGLGPALTPTFDTPVPTADGFTVNVTNYDSAYTWTPSVDNSGVVTAGTASGSTLPLTVSGLAATMTATVTVDTTRGAYGSGTATVSGTSLTPLPAGLVPDLDIVQSRGGGFRVWIKNYDATYTWTVTSTAGTVADYGGSGALHSWDITGLTPGASATVTVATSLTGYATEHIDVTGTAWPAGTNPVLGTPTSIAGGFEVLVTDFQPYEQYLVSSTAGTANIDQQGVVSVTGLTSGQSATVTVTLREYGYSDASSTATGTAAIAGLVPTIDTPVGTFDGFTVNVTNYDPAFTWTFSTPSAGVVQRGTAVGSTLPLTVSGLNAGEQSYFQISTTRTGYGSANAGVNGTALELARVPSLDPPVATANGFTVDVTNYDQQWTVNATATNGATVTVGIDMNGLLPITVTGLSPSASSTLTVDFVRTGYATGTDSVTAAALAAALTPTFGGLTSRPDGFSVTVTNYDSSLTWTPSVTSGTVTVGTPSGATLPLTVTGLTVGQTTTLTVDTTRTGYIAGTATLSAGALPAGLTPTFGTPVRTASGFTVAVTNYDATFTWTPTVSSGATVTVGTPSGSMLPLTVSGLALGQSATVTMQTGKTGVADDSATVLGSAFSVGRVPLFDTPVPTATGFTVNVTNYDATFTWTPTVSGGATVTAGTASGSTLPLTVTGLVATAGNALPVATVIVGTSKSLYGNGSGTISGTTLSIGTIPAFDPAVTRTPAGFVVTVTNHDPNLTWNVAADPGTVTTAVDPNTGDLVITVIGLASGGSSTVTVTTSEPGKADTEATFSGQALAAASAGSASAGGSSGGGSSGGASTAVQPAASSSQSGGGAGLVTPQPVPAPSDAPAPLASGGIAAIVGGKAVNIAGVGISAVVAGPCDGSANGTPLQTSVVRGSLQLVCGAPSTAAWATAFSSVTAGGTSVPVVVDPSTAAGVSPLMLVRGGMVGVQGNGMKSHADVNVFVFDAPVNAKALAKPVWVGRLVADGDGKVDGRLPIPSSVTVGEYALQLVSADRGDRQLAVTMAVQVRDAAPASWVVTARKQVAFRVGSVALGPKARTRLRLLAAQVRAAQANGAAVAVQVRGIPKRAVAVTRYLRRAGLPAVSHRAKGVTTVITTLTTAGTQG